MFDGEILTGVQPSCLEPGGGMHETGKNKKQSKDFDQGNEETKGEEI
jgi:hypothetical protein